MKRMRIQGHTCESSSKWTEEAMQFYTSQPDVQESLPQFHSRLAALADKCDFLCTHCQGSFKDRMIRDRLLITMDQELRQELLAKNPKPTTNEILRNYIEEENFFTSPGWTKILSYLPMNDLAALSGANKRLRGILLAYVKAGNALLINADVLYEYPISLYTDWYASYGSVATNLCLDGVHEIYLNPIFDTFKKITRLKVFNVTLTDIHRGLTILDRPPPLRSLALINCNTTDVMDESWSHMIDCMTSLDDLYLDSNSHFFRLTKPCNIKSITLVNQPLRNPNPLSCPNLTHLAIDYCWNDITYESISKCGKLESLKIRQGVDWKERSKVEALQLKSVDAYYWPAPTEENLILGLTGDCLLSLQRYLTAEEWWNLQQTHPRLDALSVINPQKRLKVDGARILERNPIDQNSRLYQRLGDSVTRLDLDLLNEKTLPFLKIFQRLTDLRIRSFDLDSTFLKHLPNGLQVLTLKVNRTADQDDLSALFRRLNPTLRELHINRAYLHMDKRDPRNDQQGLNELRGIQVFRVPHVRVTNELLQFLTVNKGTMYTLELGVWEASDLEMGLWPRVSQMKNLKSLHFETYSRTAPPHIPPGSLPLLKNLRIDFRPSAINMLLHLFEDPEPLPMDIQSICSGMKSLEYLELITMDAVTVNLFPHIFDLSTLKGLWVTELEDGHILPLIKGLPRLTDLVTNTEYSLDTVMGTEDLIKQTGRKVSLKNHDSADWRVQVELRMGNVKPFNRY